MATILEQAKNALCGLLKIDSVEKDALPGAPFGQGVKDALDYTLALCREYGLKTTDLDGYCGYAEIGEGDLFGILGHLDVVPVGKGWTFPPFSATISDDIIYARGAVDNKGPMIAVLFALVKLLQEGKKPTSRIRLIFGCDEESGWKCMDRYFLTEETPSLGFSPDADFPVINCEKGIVYHTITLPLPDGITNITAGERPNMVPDFATATLKLDTTLLLLAKEKGLETIVDGDILTITASGKAVHGSQPMRGDNAIIKLFSVLGAKYHTLRDISVKLGAYDGSGCNLKLSDDKSGSLTLNLGKIETKLNNLVLDLDIRHPISYNKDEITERLSRSFASVSQGFFHLPLYIPPEHPLVTALLNAYDDIMGTKSQPITIGGGTYARALPVGVAFGPSFPNTDSKIHGIDEWLSIKDLEKLINIYYLAIKELCF